MKLEPYVLKFDPALVQANVDAVYSIKNTDTVMNTKTAFETLQKAMQNDLSHAWVWQCNIAMPIYDAIHWKGVTHEKANEIAAGIMQNIFKVNVRDSKEWKCTFEQPVESKASESKSSKDEFKVGDKVQYVQSHYAPAGDLVEYGDIGTIVRRFECGTYKIAFAKDTVTRIPECLIKVGV